MNEKYHESLHKIIAHRWSPRAFSEEMISEDELKTLLEAARWAPSSMNEQPWHYLVARRGTQAFDNMVDALMEGNQSWAKNASHLLISAARKRFAYKDRENRHHLHDTGAANLSLLLQATDMDIYGHMMGGFKKDQSHASFDLDPDTFEIACFIALGKMGDPDQLNEQLKERERAPRKRNPLSEIYTDLS